MVRGGHCDDSSSFRARCLDPRVVRGIGGFVHRQGELAVMRTGGWGDSGWCDWVTVDRPTQHNTQETDQ